MEVQRYRNLYKGQAIQYTGTVSPLVQCQDLDHERRSEPEATRVRDVRSALYSRRHSQRPPQEQRHQNGTGNHKRHSEPCPSKADYILRARRPNAAHPNPKYHVIWEVQGTRPIGRPRKRWLDNIREDCHPLAWKWRMQTACTGPSTVEECCPLAAGACRFICVAEALSQVSQGPFSLSWPWSDLFKVIQGQIFFADSGNLTSTCQ